MYMYLCMKILCCDLSSEPSQRDGSAERSQYIFLLVNKNFFSQNCTPRQCSSLRRKFMECSIINPTLSVLMKHLVMGQRQNAPNFSAIHWSPHGSLVYIGQHFVTTRVVHLPKRTEPSLITEADLITESDQAARAVHSCNSWLLSIAHFILSSVKYATSQESKLFESK